jgi:hypothetical protein
MAKDDRVLLHSVWLAILMAALGSWLVVWSGRALWLELSAISHSAPLVELQAGPASGLPAGLSLLALLATMTVGSRSAKWARSGMIVAICALPLVVILPAVLLFGVGGYLSSKGYVQCQDQLSGQRFPVIRKVLPEARALCADDRRSE